MPEAGPFDPTDYDPPERHECDPPDANSISAPAGWRCRCGKAYRREFLTEHGESWWQWKRMPEADQGVA